MTVFTHKSYKDFLNEFIDQTPTLKRGGRLRLAECLRCQPAFISQVLRGDLHFSLEQAEAASRFCGLTLLEKKFFLNLVNIERAGTSELKAFFKEENLKLKKESQILAERLNIENQLGPDEAMVYYSQWYYSAIHVLITLNDCNSTEKISERLRLEPTTVREALNFLESTQLIIKKAGAYSAGKTRIHIASHSPLISNHHMNWRMKAMESLARNSIEDLHYSSVVTISKEDALLIKEELMAKIQSLKKRIQDSKEEDVFSLNLDFFRL